MTTKPSINKESLTRLNDNLSIKLLNDCDIRKKNELNLLVAVASILNRQSAYLAQKFINLKQKNCGVNNSLREDFTITFSMIKEELNNNSLHKQRVIKSMDKIMEIYSMFLPEDPNVCVRSIDFDGQDSDEWAFEISVKGKITTTAHNCFTVNKFNFYEINNRALKLFYLNLCKFSSQGQFYANKTEFLHDLFGKSLSLKDAYNKYKHLNTDLDELFDNHFDLPLITSSTREGKKLVVFFDKTLLKCDLVNFTDKTTSSSSVDVIIRNVQDDEVQEPVKTIKESVQEPVKTEPVQDKIQEPVKSVQVEPLKAEVQEQKQVKAETVQKVEQKPVQEKAENESQIDPRVLKIRQNLASFQGDMTQEDKEFNQECQKEWHEAHHQEPVFDNSDLEREAREAVLKTEKEKAEKMRVQEAEWNEKHSNSFDASQFTEIPF